MTAYQIVLALVIFCNVVRFNGITDEKIIGLNTLMILIYIFIKNWSLKCKKEN